VVHGSGSLNRSAPSEPASRNSPAKGVGRTRAFGSVGEPSSRTAAMVSRGSRASASSGPSRPWVRLAWGSASTTSTRSPRRASGPPRWWTVEVLPTPPFLFRNATVRVTAGPSAKGAVHRETPPRTYYRPAEWFTVKQRGQDYSEHENGRFRAGQGRAQPGL